jgi:hypothetical protein
LPEEFGNSPCKPLYFERKTERTEESTRVVRRNQVEQFNSAEVYPNLISRLGKRF